PDILSNNAPAACQPKPGPLADGTPCGADGQCAHAFCRKSNGSVCGVCGARGAAGAMCTPGLGNDCAYGLLCAGTCVAPAGAAGPCAAPPPCGGGLYCNNTGHCGTAPAAGATCDPADDACPLAQLLYCDPATKLCSSVGTAMSGGACGLVNNKPTLCVGG